MDLNASYSRHYSTLSRKADAGGLQTTALDPNPHHATTRPGSLHDELRTDLHGRRTVTPRYIVPPNRGSVLTNSAPPAPTFDSLT
jgi:hypothetical protein